MLVDGNEQAAMVRALVIARIMLELVGVAEVLGGAINQAFGERTKLSIGGVLQVERFLIATRV